MGKLHKNYVELSRLEIKYIKDKLNITKIEDLDTALFKRLKEELKKIKGYSK